MILASGFQALTLSLREAQRRLAAQPTVEVSHSLSLSLCVEKWDFKRLSPTLALNAKFDFFPRLWKDARLSRLRKNGIAQTNKRTCAKVD